MCAQDFWSDSAASQQQWQALGHALSQGGEVWFDSDAHNLLCEELKFLYVAITRTRKRCFIFDQDLHARQPMFEHLTSIGVAEASVEQQLSVSAMPIGRSTAQDWLRRGENLYENKLWATAERCFLRAGEKAWALDAGAKRLSQEGRMLGGNARADKFRAAAEALLRCAALKTDAFGRDGCSARAAYSFVVSARSSSEAKMRLEGYESSAVVLEARRPAPPLDEQHT